MKTKKEFSINLGLLVIAFLLLAFVDFIVLEQIYHPLSEQHNISWTSFETNILGASFPILKWHVGFFTLSIFLFILLGLAARSWRLGLSGLILFFTGWEDILYYIIQFKWLPAELPWLDASPLMTLSRFLTKTEHVTSTGVVASAVFGVIVIVMIGLIKKKKRKNKIKN